MAQCSLSVGKLEPHLLKQLVFKCLGIQDARVLLAPRIGEDASVIDFGIKALVVHSDPITGAVENVGWLAVNVCTNDVATRGIRPLWILIVLLLPENITTRQLRRILTDIDQAAKQLGIAVVGGHSEVTSGINRPIIVTTAMGETCDKKFVRTSGAKVDDSLIVTKGAAIEGTAILAHELTDFLEKKIGKKTVQKAKQFIRMTSVVKDALTAVEAGEVHAMHDATEGGIACGLQEIAWASNVGIVAYENKIPIYKETEAICKTLGIDPLRTISSGSLIIAANPESAEKILAELEQKGIRASIIGKVTEKTQNAYIVRKEGTKLRLEKPVKEELWAALKGHF
jgi:hydrogenase expression/formation protein HypE